MSWFDCVYYACLRQASPNSTVLKQSLIDYELDRIVRETRSTVANPKTSLTTALRQLKKNGYIIEVEKGVYMIMSDKNPDYMEIDTVAMCTKPKLKKMKTC
jgi:hypothetical protein